MSNNSSNSSNSTRRIIINNYLNVVDENNANIATMLNLMNNQENTLRRLIFDNESRNRSTVYSPLFNNLSSLRSNRNVTTTDTNRNSTDYIHSLSNLDNLLDTFLDPITVAPTREQIDRAITHSIYSDVNNPINTTCPIALRVFQNDDEVSVIRYCNHLFCRDDLESWFRANTRCPLCRYDIRTYVNQ
jgi:hypothetical protein